MKIEIILLGVIGVIILIDFFLKRSKKKKGVDVLVKVDVSKKQQNPKSNLNRFLFAIITSLISSAILTYTIDSYYYRGFVSLERFIYYIKLSPLVHIINFTISFGLIFFLFGLFTVKHLQYLLDRKKSIGLIIFSTIILKPIITYIFFTKKIGPFSLKGESLNWHFNQIFKYENFAFLITFLFVLSVFYFLKDSRLSLSRTKSSSRIRKLESLYKDGVITEEEYKSKKEEIRKDSLNDI
ncbi:SHOCT domain-containing protein [Flavobacteriaceae bacterium]|nr:SHOCT domain-containing protein [Flavobacteriaceae bacterium]